MKNNNQLVSIIMPVFNSEAFVAKSIDSVIEQTYQNWELIIVDDNSTDNSLKIVKEYCEKDARIKLINNKETLGAARSRNKALDAAKGRWISFLDSDDLWARQKLETQIKYMIENSYAFTCSNYYVIDEQGKIKSVYKCKKNKLNYRDILKTNSIGCLTAVIDREKCGVPYMPENAVKREDLACWLKLLRKEKYAYLIEEELAYYRVHKSVSSNKTEMAKYQWRVYRKVEKINIFMSFYYLLNWMIRGLRKY